MSNQPESPFGTGFDHSHYLDPNSPFAGPRARSRAPRRRLIVAVAAAALTGLAVAGVMLAGGSGAPAPAPAPDVPTAVPVTPSPTASGIAMPDVVGLSLPEAAAALESVSLVVGEVTEEPGGGPAGTVLSQIPSAGTSLQAGESVSLVVAAADATSVPDVKGLLRDDAEQALLAAGFTVGTITERASSQPPFTVMRQSPQPGVPTPRGSAVDLIVADASTRIPDVVGLDAAEAQATLEARGLTVRLKEERSRKDTGTVLSVTPRVGTVVEVGTRVILRVAS